MTETEADDYNLNSEGRQQTLHISLVNDKQIAMILLNKITNQQHSNYLTLQSLKNLSKAFAGVKTIKEALKIVKDTIESGNIALIEDTKDSSIFLNYDITVPSGKYQDVEVILKLEEENEENNRVQEDHPSTYDNRQKADAEAKFEKQTSGTTEYVKPIIKSDVKDPIVQLEYIEPILQIHYPDGTTRSKALPPRIQDANGENANISEEQFKLIQEQMNNNSTTGFKRLSPIKDLLNNNRSNSVAKRNNNTSMYSTQSVPYSRVNNNPFTNAVRPAMNENINNINQVRSAISVNPNQNLLNNNKIQPKTTSDYSTMTMQYKKPYYTNNGNLAFQTPNPLMQNNFNNTAAFSNSQYMMQAHNQRNLIEESRPRMTNINPNMQRNANRSLSTPKQNNAFQFYPNRNTDIYQTNQANYAYQTNLVYQQNNIKTNNYGVITRNLNAQNAQTPGLYYNQNQNQNINRNINQNINQNINPNNSGIYKQKNKTPSDNIKAINPNNKSTLAIQQSQNLIQAQQKRLQEIQQQLALIQQQRQQLQEQQRQIMLQQQKQRDIIQQQTFNRTQSQNIGNIPQNKYFAQVSHIEKNKANTQIRQVQSMINNQQFSNKSSNEIKQTKTVFNQGLNPPFRTQISTPMSIQTPSLASSQNQSLQNSSGYYQRGISGDQNNNEDEITEHQIQLAQMASMQNQENPNYQNLNAITLAEKVEEAPPTKEEQPLVNEEEEVQEQKEKHQEQVTGEDDLNIEALFMTEEGRIIFRNGLLRGIIHKYAEIDDVISKIQDILLKGVKFHLVYKAFDMGDKAATFHEKCDKLNMSLVLIETDKDIRFGGFTTKSWEGNNLKKKDNDSFVFSLETNSIFDVIKNEPAIGCYPKFGPVFFGCQIRIYDEFFTKGGTTCHKGLNFKTNKDYELNNGEQKYLIKDIEVYSIEAIDI